MAKQPKLGTGARFEKLEKSIASKGNVRNPAAVAAAIGRKKYGAKKMGKLSHHEHGMQMGTEGYGMLHGCSSYHEGDHHPVGDHSGYGKSDQQGAYGEITGG